jgi:hypothetical protein
VSTNLPISDLVKLGEEALHLPRTAIQHAVPNYANGSVSDAMTTGGADVLLLHPTALHRLVTKVFAPVLGHMGEASVQVENGAPTQQDLATYFSHVLDGMGATTLTPEQAAHTNHHANEVFWNSAVTGGRPAPALAYMLAQMLQTRMVVKARPESKAQIVVVLGSVFPKVQGGPSNPSIASNAPAATSNTPLAQAGNAQGKGATPSSSQPTGRSRSGQTVTGQTAPAGVALPGVPSPTIQAPGGIEVPPRIGLPGAVGGGGTTAGGAGPSASGASGQPSGSTAPNGTTAGSTTSAGAPGQSQTAGRGTADTQSGGTAAHSSSSSAPAGLATAATRPSSGTATPSRAGASPTAKHGST